MSDWGSGYVVDAAYVHDFCYMQAPSMLALAALAGGVLSPGGSDEPLAWCDLGCGQGYTANLVAAANPAARVFGFDFNPGQIANARALASAGGLSNVEFREASFEELHADPALPEFDIICIHGVFSWVSAENRRTLVALIRKRLKPGGLLYVSYDSMPGWASFAPLRRIFPRHFAPGPGLASATAAERALAYAEGLRAVDSRYHRIHSNVEALTTRLKATPRDFLAHEILTRNWEAFSFSEVASALAEAKLVFIGSAHLSDGVDYLNFTEAQSSFLATLEDPILAETTRDMILLRIFRRDVFVKGITAPGAASLTARWLDTRFALTTPASELDMSFETALGKHEFHPEAHKPLLEALSNGPLTLRDALRQTFAETPNLSSLIDAIKILVARGDLQPALPVVGDSARAASTRALNTALLGRALEGRELPYLASPVTGGGVRVDRLTQLYLAARREGISDVDLFVSKVAEAAVFSGADGNRLSPDEVRETLQKAAARIATEVAPLLRQLGVE